MQIPDGSVVMGSPAKVVKQLPEKHFKLLEDSAAHYANNAQNYLANLRVSK